MYNIGCGARATVNELFRTVARLLDMPEAEAVYSSARAGDVLHSLADIGAAREEFGYDPQTGLESGLNETVAWYREALGRN